jgi:hypothetical protein
MFQGSKMMSAAKGLFAGVFLCVFAPSANAAVVYSYDETACFGSSCTLAASSTDSHLTFNNQAFSNVPAGTVDLGTLTLANGTNDYSGDSFRLKVTFTVPLSSSDTYTASFRKLYALGE